MPPPKAFVAPGDDPNADGKDDELLPPKALVAAPLPNALDDDPPPKALVDDPLPKAPVEVPPPKALVDEPPPKADLDPAEPKAEAGCEGCPKTALPCAACCPKAELVAPVPAPNADDAPCPNADGEVACPNAGGDAACPNAEDVPPGCDAWPKTAAGCGCPKLEDPNADVVCGLPKAEVVAWFPNAEGCPNEDWPKADVELCCPNAEAWPKADGVCWVEVAPAPGEIAVTGEVDVCPKVDAAGLVLGAPEIPR